MQTETKKEKIPLCKAPGMNHVYAPCDNLCVHCGIRLPMQEGYVHAFGGSVIPKRKLAV